MADPITNPATPDAIFGKDAVTAALAGHAACSAALTSLKDFITDAKWDRNELTLTVAPETIRAAAQAAKDAGYNFLEDVTAIDWYPAEPRFQVAYSILSMGLKQRIRLNARVSGDDPRIDSITPSGPEPTSTSAKSSTSSASTSPATPASPAS